MKAMDGCQQALPQGIVRRICDAILDVAGSRQGHGFILIEVRRIGGRRCEVIITSGISERLVPVLADLAGWLLRLTEGM